MNTLPSNLKQIALFLERLPGIGEKTANRLAFYFLRLPERDLKEFAKHLNLLKSSTKLCKNCLNLTERELCLICSDESRDKGLITVVEEVLDLLSFETGGIYKGLYHVLHGRIDPLNNVRAEDIYIDKLISNVKAQNSKLKEIILAMNPDIEGEATAMYVRDRLKEIQRSKFKDQRGRAKFKITRLAYGLPIGASLEYADYMTLRKAIEGRSEY